MPEPNTSEIKNLKSTWQARVKRKVPKLMQVLTDQGFGETVSWVDIFVFGEKLFGAQHPMWLDFLENAGVAPAPPKPIAHGKGQITKNKPKSKPGKRTACKGKPCKAPLKTPNNTGRGRRSKA